MRNTAPETVDGTEDDSDGFLADSSDNYIYLQLVLPSGQLSGSAIDVSGAGPATEAKVVWAGDHFAVSFLEGGLVMLAQMSPDPVPSVARVQVVSGAAGHADNPALTWSGSALGLAWQDDRSGNQDIYFREVLP